MSQSKIKVLNVIGYERSGTTILHNVLGQIPGFFAAGELSEIWELLGLDKKPCGCGAQLKKCPIWSEIFRELYSLYPELSLERMLEARKKIQNRNLVKLWLLRKNALASEQLSQFFEVADKLYTTIQKHTNSSLIIDTSKVPFYSYLLNQSSQLEVYVLHLVREPKAVEYSLWKRKVAGHKGYKRHNTITGVFGWLFLNSMIELYQGVPHPRYMRLRFEDFVHQPQKICDSILDFVNGRGGYPFELPEVKHGNIFLNPTHSVTGSPSRFNTGLVELKLDDTWKTKMPIANQAIVNGLTWPFMGKYKQLF